MQILQIHIHVLLVTLSIRVTCILLPSWIKKKKIDPFKNSQGWIYNFFFYSKFQKMIYITLFFKKCILISLSTYKPINTKKYLTMIYNNFGSLQRWWVLPGPNITAGTKKRARYSTWCHTIRSQGNWWGPVLHCYFICDQNNLKKLQNSAIFKPC